MTRSTKTILMLPLIGNAMLETGASTPQCM
jgi:hypothetical protein